MCSTVLQTRISKIVVAVALIWWAATAVSCDTLLGTLPASTEVLDGPVDGLSAEELAAHVVADQEFGHIFTPAEGIGPIFNQQACESCHATDGRGHSATLLTRFGRLANGVIDPLIEQGGPQLQDKALPGFRVEYIPSTANVRAQFLAPPVAGLGYLEAVSDSTILALEDPNDRDADGISGVAAFVDAPAYFTPRASTVHRGSKVLARFGRKCTAVDLLHQTVNALFNDMGLSSDYHPTDIRNVQQSEQLGDVVTDPEVSAGRVDALAYYVRTTKAPARRHDQDAAVLRGEKIFQQIGCAGCHTATLHTGNAAIAALSNKDIHPYTDLLLHDMGAELNDGYTEGAAQSAEWRTTPLWGLGLAGVSTGGQLFLLHDGRAHSYAEAILLHGGEGAASRTRYQALSKEQQQDLKQFLDSL